MFARGATNSIAIVRSVIQPNVQSVPPLITFLKLMILIQPMTVIYANQCCCTWLMTVRNSVFYFIYSVSLSLAFIYKYVYKTQ